MATFRSNRAWVLLLLLPPWACGPGEGVKTKGESAQVWLARANRDIAESRWKQAEKGLLKALEGGEDVALELAEVQVVLGEWASATEYLEAKLQASQTPNIQARCHLSLGLIAWHQDRDDEALKHFAKALTLNPNTPNAHFHMADIHRHNGRYDMARAAYLEAVKANPSDAIAVEGAILAGLKIGRHRDLAPLLNQARRRMPNHPRLIALQVRLLAANVYQSRDNAGISLTLAKLLDPTEPSGDHLEVLAMALAANGDFEKALASQTRAIALAEGNDDATTAACRKLQQNDYANRKAPAQAFHPGDARWSAKSLDPMRDSPYGLLPLWRRPNIAMTDRIAAYADSPIANRSAYLNDVQADHLARLLQQNMAPEKRAELQVQYAVELLRAGRTEAAIHQIEEVEGRFPDDADASAAGQGETLGYLKAIAYLRLAEQENCLENHTTASCLFPIAPAGVHRLPRGARGAVTQLEAQLKAHPDNRSARWLFNLAYMLLGAYPDEVPAEYLIDRANFESPKVLQPFRDVAMALGLDRSSLAGGSLVEDFDGDGYLDILTSSWGPKDPLQLFLNHGAEGFVEAIAGSGLEGIDGGLNLMQTDYDNDGRKDVLVLRGAWLDQAGLQPNSLLRNLGGGHFEDVTEASGLLSFRPTQTAVWLDFDNDGWLDLFIGNETASAQAHPCELFHNQGDGTFLEIAAETGLDLTGFVKGVTAGDVDGDGLTDLFISRYQQPNILMKNQGPDAHGTYHFSDISKEAGVTLPLNSFPTWFWDYDNDGDLDLFVADYNHVDVGTVAADLQGLSHRAEASKLYRNRGDGTFEDVTEPAGLARIFVAMGCNFGDFDNDGNLDFYLGTGSPNLAMLIPNRLLAGDASGHFQELTSTLELGHLQKGHGISFADLDHDGDQDIHAVLGGAYSGDLYRNALFENPGYGNHWLTLELVGTSANRAAIGTKVAITVETRAGLRTLYRWVTSGGSFGASPLRMNIGLGQAEKIREVGVTWNGEKTTQTFTGMRMNAAYRLTQKEPAAEALNLPAFTFAGHVQHRHH